jgi:hypothetical protein
LPQVPEQEDPSSYIGLFQPCDFDMYLYESLGFCFLERYIPTEDFKKYVEEGRIDPSECINELKKLRDHCDRVIKKINVYV